MPDRDALRAGEAHRRQRDAHRHLRLLPAAALVVGEHDDAALADRHEALARLRGTQQHGLRGRPRGDRRPVERITDRSGLNGNRCDRRSGHQRSDDKPSHHRADSPAIASGVKVESSKRGFTA